MSCKHLIWVSLLWSWTRLKSWRKSFLLLLFLESSLSSGRFDKTNFLVLWHKINWKLILTFFTLLLLMLACKRMTIQLGKSLRVTTIVARNSLLSLLFSFWFNLFESLNSFILFLSMRLLLLEISRASTSLLMNFKILCVYVTTTLFAESITSYLWVHLDEKNFVNYYNSTLLFKSINKYFTFYNPKISLILL